MTSALEASTNEFGQIKAVCLDIDDTLLDNASASKAGLKALVGNDAAWAVWRRTTEEHYTRFVAGEISFDTMCRARTRSFFAAFGEEISDTEAAEREERRMAAMQRAWCLFDDALPCLEWLRSAGVRLAVITNAPSAYQRKKISSVGLADAFDEVVISEELGAAKPDHQIYETACSTLGVQPHEAVHIGDRLEIDAMGAASAGLHGVWLNREGRQETLPSEISMITALDELPELLVCDLPNASLAPSGLADSPVLASSVPLETQAPLDADGWLSAETGGGLFQLTH